MGVQRMGELFPHRVSHGVRATSRIGPSTREREKMIFNVPLQGPDLTDGLYPLYPLYPHPRALGGSPPEQAVPRTFRPLVLRGFGLDHARGDESQQRGIPERL